MTPRISRLVAALLVLGSALTMAAPASNARTSNVFSGVADGRLLALNFTATPSVVFDQLVDAGGAVAQAELDSLGTSTAFASDPYPSGTVVGAAGLVAGATGGRTSGVIPNYPLITSSNYPGMPESEVSAPPIRLQARSRSISSWSTAINQLGIGTASVEFDPESGSVTATATAEAGTVRLSDTISIAGVRSMAVATRTNDGPLELGSTFESGGLIINGQRVSLDAVGGGDEDPLNTTATALLGLLALQDIEVEVVPSERTDDSITSAGLRIRMVQPSPDLPPPPALPEIPLPPVPGLPAILALPGGVSGVESVTTEIIIGRVTARVDNRALPAFSGGGGAAPTTPLAASSPSGGAFSALPAHLGGPGPSPLATTGGQAATPVREVAPSTVATRPSVYAHVSIARFYPVLLLAALVCVATTTLIGKLGVREP